MKLDFQRNEPKELRQRTYKAVAIVAVLFGILFIRLWYLQVFERDRFKKLSENNRIRLIITNPQRGKIFDRNGRVLVDNRPAFNLTAIPEDIKDTNKLLMDLKRFTSIEPASEEIIDILKKKGKRSPFKPVVLKSDLSWDEVARVETFKLGLPGVSLNVEPKRNYIYKDYLSPFIGYIGEIERKHLKKFRFGDYRAGDLVGKAGIEETWEESLRGRRGGLQVEVDVLGRVKQILHEVEPVSGNNIYLTIDMDIQKAAKEAIGKMAGAVVAIDPKTGEILAMVSNPSYDPNIFSANLTTEKWQKIISNPLRLMENKAIQGQYPPASTFKVVTAAAALEEDVIRENVKIFSGSDFTLGNRSFRDWKKKGHGWINVHQAIVESADTFFYQLGIGLGIDRIATFARGFGFGSKTGVDLKGEKNGLVPDKRWKEMTLHERWYEGETIPVSVGQGYLLVTPLQLLNAFAAIANGGRLLRPHLVKEVVNTKGEILYNPDIKELGRLPVSDKTLRIIKKALLGVVNEPKGTGKNAHIRGFDVAGKTGTAQVVSMGEEDEEDKTEIPFKLRSHSWFAGFAPYKDPKIAVVALVEHGGFGAAVAAPIAKKVIKAYLIKGGTRGLRH